ncbi:MAG: Spy/CpxP family protein refolding chaperone, partial [Acetobacteraceae bacterium]
STPPAAAPASPGVSESGQPALHAPREAGQHQDMIKRVEHHIKQLHAELQITPAEQPQWDQFAQAMRENAQDMRQSFDQRGAQLAQQHAQDMQRLTAAFQSLYDSMPSQQQQSADAVFRGRLGHHHAHAHG